MGVNPVQAALSWVMSGVSAHCEAGLVRLAGKGGQLDMAVRGNAVAEVFVRSAVRAGGERGTALHDGDIFVRASCLGVVGLSGVTPELQKEMRYPARCARLLYFFIKARLMAPVPGV